MKPYDTRDVTPALLSKLGYGQEWSKLSPQEVARLQGKRRAGHQPATAHPWRNQQPDDELSRSEGKHFNVGEDGQPQPIPSWHQSGHPHFCSNSGGFSQDYIIRHDPDGWNPRFDGSGQVKHLVKDGRPLTERGAELLNRPQPVVVSPSKNPPHSQQTKQVHQYQQKQGRK